MKGKERSGGALKTAEVLQGSLVYSLSSTSSGRKLLTIVKSTDESHDRGLCWMTLFFFYKSFHTLQSQVIQSSRFCCVDCLSVQ